MRRLVQIDAFLRPVRSRFRGSEWEGVSKQLRRSRIRSFEVEQRTFTRSGGARDWRMKATGPNRGWAGKGSRLLAVLGGVIGPGLT